MVSFSSSGSFTLEARDPSTDRIGGWMDARAGLDMVTNRKICASVRNQTPVWNQSPFVKISYINYKEHYLRCNTTYPQKKNTDLNAKDLHNTLRSPNKDKSKNKTIIWFCVTVDPVPPIFYLEYGYYSLSAPFNLAFNRKGFRRGGGG